jgi:hypothetical protein
MSLASRRWHFMRLAFVAWGYAGDRIASVAALRAEIARNAKEEVCVALRTRRGMVERFLAWIDRNCRLATHFAATIASANACLDAVSPGPLVARRSPIPLRPAGGAGCRAGPRCCPPATRSASVGDLVSGPNCSIGGARMT